MISLNVIDKIECCIPTFSGQRLDLSAPAATQIDIEDIAHGLAYQSCFNGQTSTFYSLAQHSLLVASLVPAPQRLAALLHDAAAAYLGDSAPSLRKLLPEFAAIEAKLTAAIREKFGLAGFEAPAIKRAHLIALATEQRDVWPNMSEASGERSRLAPIPRRIEFMSPEEARYQFKELFTELAGKLPARQTLHVVAAGKSSTPATARPISSQLPKQCHGVLAQSSREVHSLMAIDGGFRQTALTAARL